MSADPQRTYQEALASEQAAWTRVWEARQRGEELDPAVLADWLAASRLAAAARNKTLDKLMAEDPGLMNRRLGSKPEKAS